MFDKRKFPRLGEIWELDYRKIGLEEFKKDPLNTFTVNISGGGIRVEADEEIPKGTMLVLELRSTIFPSTIIGIGKTIWCKMGRQEDKYDIELNSGGQAGEITTPKKRWRNTSTKESLGIAKSPE